MKINKKILKKILAESSELNEAMLNVFEISSTDYLRIRCIEILNELRNSTPGIDWQAKMKQVITLLALSRYKNGAAQSQKD